nr:mechanosensitive ion channel domain-containing protein [Candidatus Krumholzibacteria bacterium]
MEKLRDLLGDSGPLIHGVVVVLLVVAGLMALRKVLDIGESKVSGKKFRNQLVMFAATFVGILAVVLGLPLEDSVRGQLLTLIGILISAGIALSGGTFLSNAMAGIMLKAVRNFRSGDFISTGEHFGRVTERGLFHTEIQTPDRDLITLPNLLLANNAVRVVRQSGTIISATVSLGYDVPHHRIEGVLVLAATDLGLEEPFVQILELGDFSVTYRVAGLLADSKQMITYRSRLRAAILDGLHADGIEIVSPDFANARVFETTHSFIPRMPVSAAPPPVQDAPPAAVVFDKAEDAESLAKLRERFNALAEEIETAKKETKEAETEQQKTAGDARLAFLDKKKDALQRAITLAEERESQHE